jgi:hypothetical protein
MLNISWRSHGRIEGFTHFCKFAAAMRGIAQNSARIKRSTTR